MGIDPSKYVIRPDDEIGDVDLDEEPITVHGERLDEARAEQLAIKALEVRRRNLVPGGKSLSGGAVHSPRVSFRVPETLREDAERVATEHGVSLSRLAREALEEYVTRH